MSLVARLRQRFDKLEQGERRQVVFLAIMLVIGLYGAAAGLLWKGMFEAEKLADRRENRLKTNVGQVRAPELSHEFSDTVLKALQQEYQGYQEKLEAIEQKRVPLDSPEPREQLKLALTRLAAQNRVEILSLKSVMPEALPGAAKVSPALQRFASRPYFSLECQARYQDFVAFTEGLNGLPFSGFVRQLRIARPAPDKTATPDDGRLHIAVEFQL